MSVCNCSDGTIISSDLGVNCPDGCWSAYTSKDGSNDSDGKNLNGSNTKAGGVFRGFLEGMGLIGSGDDGPGEKSQNCQKLKDWTGVDLCKYLKWALIIIAIILLLKIALAIKKLF